MGGIVYLAHSCREVACGPKGRSSRVHRPVESPALRGNLSNPNWVLIKRTRGGDLNWGRSEPGESALVFR